MKRQFDKLFQRRVSRVRLYVGIAAFMILAGWAVFPRAVGIITTKAQGSCTAAPSGLAAWYPFEGSGNDIQGGSNATITGNAAFTAGEVGRALQFDGNAVSAKVNASSKINVGAGGGMTVDAWIKPTDLTTPQPLVEWNNGVGNHPFGVHFWINSKVGGTPDGALFANIVDTNGGDHYFSSAAGALTANAFQHVAVSYDKSDGAHGYAKLYINGVSVALNDTANNVVDLGVFTPQTGYDLYFGLRPAPSAYHYKGLIDELELFNRALSEAEIQAIYNAGSATRCAPPDRIQFSAATYSHVAQGNALLTVTRTNPQNAAGVQYATSDGTATAGVDYTSTSGALNFAPGESSKTIGIPITSKTVSGPDRTLNVTLSNPTGDGVLGTPSTAVLTIGGSVGRILLQQGNADMANIVEINTDAGGSNRINLTDLRYGNGVKYPSVSATTGMIAFQGCGVDFPSPSGCAGDRIFVMNSDATGVKQLTLSAGLQDPNNQGDHSPVISPDGTKVAFVSGRSRYPVDGGGNTQNDEVFVVNVDGTGLHQVTTKQNAGSDNSRAYSVAWGPDSSKLVVRGTRLYHGAVSGDHIAEEVFTVNLDGSGEKVLALAGVGANDLHAGDQSLPLADKAVDWSPDGANVVFAANYAPASNTSGIIDYVVMNPSNPSAYHLVTSDRLGGTAASAFDGSVRFSPDGRQLVYGLRDDSSVRRIDLDGTNQLVVVTNDGGAAFAKWWMGGPAIPQPARFTLTPNPVTLYTGLKQQVTPTLYDADGNVIVHAGVYTDGLNFNGSPYIDFNFLVTGGAGTYEDLKLCASNAGLSDCTAVRNVPPDEFLSVTATTPTASNADHTPGTFTVSRASSATSGAGSALTIYYALGGTATQNGDYTISPTANPITLPAGQNSVTFNVAPTGNSAGHGDKTVTLTLLPAVEFQYVVNSNASSADVTIKDDGPPPTNQLRLTSSTPGTGGKGKVTITIYGQNIQRCLFNGPTLCANVPYVQLIGASPHNAGQKYLGVVKDVAADGTWVTATFDLSGDPQNEYGGYYDVVVTNDPNGSLTSDTATLPKAFYFDDLGAFCQLNACGGVWVDLVGNFTVRGGYTQTFYIVYGNSSEVDSDPTEFTITIPSGLRVAALPVLDDGSSPTMELEYGDGGTVLKLMVPYVPGRSTKYLPLQLMSAPSTAHETLSVKLEGFTTAQFFDRSEVEGHDDPSATVTQQVLVDTDTDAQVIDHVSTSSGSGDISWEASIRPASALAEPVFNYTDDGTTITGDITVTVPSDYLNALVSGSVPTGLNISSAAAPNFKGRAGASNAPTSPIVEFHEKIKEARLLLGVVNKVKEAREVFEETEAMDNLADCLVRAQLISQTTVDAIVRNGNIRRSFAVTLIPLEATEHFFKFPFGLQTHKFMMNSIEAADELGFKRTPVTDIVADLMSQNGYTNVPPNPALASYWSQVHIIIDKILHSRTNTDEQDFWRTKLIRFLMLQSGCHTPGYSTTTNVQLTGLNSHDPNVKSGSQGSGTAHYVSGAQPLRYVISFENVATATAPAQAVVVTDQLDTTNLDLSTFSLGAFGFSSTGAGVPHGLTAYSTDVDLRPQNNLLVHVNAALDKQSGLLTWSFTSVDPATGKPTTDPAAGFLPPDKNAPEGQGSVSFSVMPKAGLSTGTQINNQATIVFDKNAAINTNVYLNTIDNSPPTSNVQALAPQQSSVLFPVSWSGADAGSGVASYDIYVSANGGAFAPWQSATTATSALFVGQPATTYSFYSVAHDAVGNVESAKTTADATTATRTDITNDIDDTRFFVRQHYLDFLLREPDQSGWDFWTSNVESCGSDAQCREVKRIDTSAAFFLSIEFQQTGYLVERMYKAAFGNLPGKPVPLTRASFAADAQEIASTPAQVVVNQGNWQAQLETNKQAYALDFVQRPRFTARYPTTQTPAQFVDALFANTGVTPSASARSTATGEFGTATDTSDNTARSRALRDVAEDATFTQAEFDRAFVLMQYFGYLRRDPDAAPDSDFSGYNFWLSKLDQFHGDYVQAEMVRAFISSIEYRRRFGP